MASEMEVNDEIFKAIFHNDLDRLRTIYVDHNIGTWNRLDRRGMAPIHYAAFKGNLEIVSWLVAEGSDVNYGKHKYQNSPLHFAALNGNIDVCRLLLDSGARRYTANGIDRTAAQIANDNGNFHCAKLINNYVHKKEVTYYAIPDSTESELKLSPALAELLYEFIMMTNIHPVKVVFELPSVFLVDDNAFKIFNVLHSLSKREFNKRHDTKEILSFKFHYLASILFEVSKSNDETSKRQTDPKNVFLEKISESHIFLNRFLYGCIVKFSFKDSSLFKRMVSYMSQGMDSLLPLEIILLVFGNKRAQNVETAKELPIICGTCNEINASKKCSKCKTVQYCNRVCLRIHSAMHKKECKQIREDNKALKSSNKISGLAKCLSKLKFK